MTTVNYILQPKTIIIYAVVLITLFEATAQVFLKSLKWEDTVHICIY